ncbi:MAG: glycosyltransferase [Gemmatimonadota bacterium]|nr:glycosyltransferase [Gemmatimonadota bacterium]
MSELPRLSVVVPVHNAQLTIDRCMVALLSSDLSKSEWELVAVDDASTDDSASRAAASADRLVRLSGRPRGPAFARNRGSEVARAPIICFVDSDVCVDRSALSRIVAHFTADPELSGVFGSYDNTPGDKGFVSQYRNLLHHYIHQRNRGEVESFWAGCGALTRAAFMGAGRFDENRFDRAQIEDVELGYRVRDRGGRIFLDPEITGTHLKRWTLAQMLRVDFSHRGVPWMQLLLERARLMGGGGLSVGSEEKVSVALVGTLLLSLAISVMIGNAYALILPGFCFVLLVAVNRRLIAWYAKVRGLWFAARVVPMLVLYHATNVAAAVYGLSVHGFGKAGKKLSLKASE